MPDVTQGRAGVVVPDFAPLGQGVPDSKVHDAPVARRMMVVGLVGNLVEEVEIAGDDPVRELYAPHPPGFRFV